MRDTELYAQILGLRSPWQVTGVTLDREVGLVKVQVAARDHAFVCPSCGVICPGYDRRLQQWRHLDTMQYQTILEAEVPRVNCRTHGVLTVEVPWAEQGSGFTALFEALVIDWLQEASVKAVARMLRTTWGVVDRVMQRAVARGLARRGELQPLNLSVDETSFQKHHEYVTVVTDQDKRCVLYVADNRETASLDGFFELLSAEQKAGIRSVAMDMWQPYINATQAAVPDALSKIAFDKFHVAQHLGTAVDKVRRREHRALQAEGDERLKGTKYAWLKNPVNMTGAQRERLALLRAETLQTARAWALKQEAMSLWGYQFRGWARKAWKHWLDWAQRCRLKPMLEAAKLIKRHLWGILNAIVLKSHNGHSESMNSCIQRIKRQACGFRNRERFRNAIYFHCGGLDLYPAKYDQAGSPT
jgi:transposase